MVNFRIGLGAKVAHTVKSFVISKSDVEGEKNAGRREIEVCTMKLSCIGEAMKSEEMRANT